MSAQGKSQCSMTMPFYASCHKSRATTDFLAQQKIQILLHPDYSPDFSPCDFWLFPTLKGMLTGRKFVRVHNMAKAVNSELRGIPSLDYHNAFVNWRTRLQQCVDTKGE